MLTACAIPGILSPCWNESEEISETESNNATNKENQEVILDEEFKGEFSAGVLTE